MIHMLPMKFRTAKHLLISGLVAFLLLGTPHASSASAPSIKTDAASSFLLFLTHMAIHRAARTRLALWATSLPYMQWTAFGLFKTSVLMTNPCLFSLSFMALETVALYAITKLPKMQRFSHWLLASHKQGFLSLCSPFRWLIGPCRLFSAMGTRSQSMDPVSKTCSNNAPSAPAKPKYKSNGTSKTVEVQKEYWGILLVSRKEPRRLFPVASSRLMRSEYFKTMRTTSLHTSSKLEDGSRVPLDYNVDTVRCIAALINGDKEVLYRMIPQQMPLKDRSSWQFSDDMMYNISDALAYLRQTLMPLDLVHDALSYLSEEDFYCAALQIIGVYRNDPQLYSALLQNVRSDAIVQSLLPHDGYAIESLWGQNFPYYEGRIIGPRSLTEIGISIGFDAQNRPLCTSIRAGNMRQFIYGDSKGKSCLIPFNRKTELFVAGSDDLAKVFFFRKRDSAFICCTKKNGTYVAEEFATFNVPDYEYAWSPCVYGSYDDKKGVLHVLFDDNSPWHASKYLLEVSRNKVKGVSLNGGGTLMNQCDIGWYDQVVFHHHYNLFASHRGYLYARDKDRVSLYCRKYAWNKEETLGIAFCGQDNIIRLVRSAYFKGLSIVHEKISPHALANGLPFIKSVGILNLTKLTMCSAGTSSLCQITNVPYGTIRKLPYKQDYLFDACMSKDECHLLICVAEKIVGDGAITYRPTMYWCRNYSLLVPHGNNDDENKTYGI
jgi:hypothetical protein